MGIYLRTTQRRNRDGSVVRYVQLAHNHRVDGVTQAQVLVNFGREESVDRDGLRRLVASINRYLGEDDGSDAAQALGADGVGAGRGGLRLTGSSATSCSATSPAPPIPTLEHTVGRTTLAIVAVIATAAVITWRVRRHGARRHRQG